MYIGLPLSETLHSPVLNLHASQCSAWSCGFWDLVAPGHECALAKIKLGNIQMYEKNIHYALVVAWLEHYLCIKITIINGDRQPYVSVPRNTLTGEDTLIKRDMNSELKEKTLKIEEEQNIDKGKTKSLYFQPIIIRSYLLIY